ncbi:tryptophan halogenase family protein [Caulobacter sp. X]|uniref:tryptophan halogenase family protein n=1 Tax=Caulobacter sp. X TaxID=2048901 RepID=UPI000C1492B8|nr:tryptophan halogenase family protein [Caulobacter sp. X]PIB95230.1 tryptophan halogenase [Caulobacter sp. X]
MDRAIQRVLVVGGGTAGWLTAGTLAAMSRGKDARPLEVALVESPNVPIIGVGEGTWPTMRRTLKRMGIKEADFIRECDASFKQGAKFARWVTGEPDDFYYHPLVLPKGYFETNLVPHWLQSNADLSFSRAVCPQEALCENGLAPKKITSAEFEATANYAYHLDAGKFADFLRRHCVDQLGVRHVLADVTQVIPAENGDIAAIETQQAGRIDADLFVDCTGMRSVLLGGHFQVPFKSCKDTLFIDRALAMQAPYAEPQSPIASHTISTAQPAGWIWDIGLQSRRGTGMVYSSAHCSDEQAEERLHAYVQGLGADPRQLSSRTIRIEPGHREQFWVRNCVGVGLAAGFLEPLEASAILLIEIAAQFIGEQMPTTRSAMEVVARRFNNTFRYRWERIIDFLKLHYILSRREDDAFWIDNRATDTIPESLSEALRLYRHQPPWHDDFDRAVEVFPAASYQYILYGMGFQTEPSPRGLSADETLRAQKLMDKVRDETEALVGALDANRDLLAKISRYGLAAI